MRIGRCTFSKLHRQKYKNGNITRLLNINFFSCRTYTRLRRQKMRDVTSCHKLCEENILYDMERKGNDIKHAVIARRMMEIPENKMDEIKNDLDVVLPINTIENFVLFEEAVATSADKKRALVSTNII